MALVHDLAEAITGDIDYLLIVDGGVSETKKKKFEQKAFQKIREFLPKTGNEICVLWEEFEKGHTEEARFVKAIDRFEALTHMLDAGYRVFDKRPDIIPNYADSAVNNFPAMAPFLTLIKNRFKKEFKKGHILWKKEYELIKKAPEK